jgi:uncharacterized glyoxalase superfamily protein PhnB
MYTRTRLSQIFVFDQDEALDFYVGKLGLEVHTDDARATYDELVARGVDVTDEPTEKSYGIDFGIRDPFGNRIRIGQIAGE